MKVCSSCGVEQPLENFYHYTHRRDGRLPTCKGCRLSHKKRMRDLKNNGDYNKLLNRQGGRCAICQEPMDKPQADHDHETGAVRGLLCINCNTALGKFRDSPFNLLGALDYLEAA